MQTVQLVCNSGSIHTQLFSNNFVYWIYCQSEFMYISRIYHIVVDGNKFMTFYPHKIYPYMLGSNRVYICMTSSSSNNIQQQAHALELSIQWTTLFLCCAKNMCQLLLLPGIKYMLYCCELCGHNLWSMVVICAFRYLGQVWRNTERERGPLTIWPHGGSKVDNIYELWKCAQRIPQFFGVNAGNGFHG